MYMPCTGIRYIGLCMNHFYICLARNVLFPRTRQDFLVILRLDNPSNNNSSNWKELQAPHLFWLWKIMCTRLPRLHSIAFHCIPVFQCVSYPRGPGKTVTWYMTASMTVSMTTIDNVDPWSTIIKRGRWGRASQFSCLVGHGPSLYLWHPLTSVAYFDLIGHSYHKIRLTLLGESQMSGAFAWKRRQTAISS